MNSCIGFDFIKAAAGTWRTAVAMLAYPVFWLKLWIYFWHFGSVLLSAACVARYWRKPGVWLLLGVRVVVELGFGLMLRLGDHCTR